MPDVLAERVRIAGPIGSLCGELAYPSGAVEGAALLLSPHPMMGGRMSLPLMARMAAAIAGSGLVCLRFDYRGVGESRGTPADVAATMEQFWRTGVAPEDPGYVEDAAAALAWLADQHPGPVSLVGYSFGAYVATRIAGERTPVALVAPTLAKHDYAAFAAASSPALVVYGDADFATGEQEFTRWAAARDHVTLVHVPSGDHFFRGSEPRIAGVVAAFLRLHAAPHPEVAS